MDHIYGYYAIVDDADIIKVEDSPGPTSSSPIAVTTPRAQETQSATAPAGIVIDPRDPEGLLRRCAGYNKKTRAPCGAAIGKKSQKDAHPTYLPTCHAHRDQQTHAGRCQFMQVNGERCGRLFAWQPPYFELCGEHQGHPDTPCYFIKLPLELRLDIFRYLLPTGPIGSSLSPAHRDPIPVGTPRYPDPNPPRRRYLACGGRAWFGPSQTQTQERSTFPFPLMDLFLVSHQIYAEVKDLVFSVIPFTIDIRKDGTFMCGRRLIEPRRADGSAHFTGDEAGPVARRFIESFDFKAVKNYDVHILIENWNSGTNLNMANTLNPWDQEVEIYDIRDYVGVAVNGILSKSRNLCKLNVRLGVSKFQWSDEELFENAKRLVGPFERLRNVRQPRFCGVFEGTTRTPYMINYTVPPPTRLPPLCSVPQLPACNILLGPGNTDFDAYKAKWERLITQTASGLPRKPPIVHMFTEFKQFYTKLSFTIPEVTDRTGRHAFLHRARVARENEDVESFRHLRNELIEYWYSYLDREEAKKQEMHESLSRMLDMDVYPSGECEESVRRDSTGSDLDTTTVLDADKMTTEGIPMQGNQMSDRQRRAYRVAQIRLQGMQRLAAVCQQSVHAQAPPRSTPNSAPHSTTAPMQAQTAMTLNPSNIYPQKLQILQAAALKSQSMSSAFSSFASGSWTSEQSSSSMMLPASNPLTTNAVANTFGAPAQSAQGPPPASSGGGSSSSLPSNITSAVLTADNNVDLGIGSSSWDTHMSKQANMFGPFSTQHSYLPPDGSSSENFELAPSSSTSYGGYVANENQDWNMSPQPQQGYSGSRASGSSNKSKVDTGDGVNGMGSAETAIDLDAYNGPERTGHGAEWSYSFMVGEGND